MSLNGVDSNGVRPEVINGVEWARVFLEDPTRKHTPDRCMLYTDMAVTRRDAEYIVECLRVLMQQERMAEKVILSLNHLLSDEANDVFGRFLSETPCHLQALWLWSSPPRQARRLLAALRVNISVKELCILQFKDMNLSSWIADLLRHKANFTKLQFVSCHFAFAQILPLLRHGQPNLQSLIFTYCCNISQDVKLFNDPQFTQLFVDNILLSPPPTNTLKTLRLIDCGESLENRPLMVGIQKNTTITQLVIDKDAVMQHFFDPIMRRNLLVGHVHDLLGTKRTLTLPAAGDLVIAPTIPPPCGLWTTVLSKVGQEPHGANAAFMILCDRLVTWMILPSSATGTDQAQRCHQKHAISATSDKHELGQQQGTKSDGL